MRRKIAGLIVGGIVALGCAWGAGQAVAAPEERDLSGTWQLSGWNMGTDRSADADYTGTVSVEAKGNHTYVVEWSIGGRVVNRGVGIYDERTDAFAAGYAIGRSPGVAIWNISDDGQVMDCVGTFQDKIGQVAYEEWRRE